MQFDYWIRQDPAKPLYPDIEWNKPEQKGLAGKLLIIGGNKHGFAAVAQSYTEAHAAGIGQVRAMLPDSFAKTIPPNTLDTLFVPTNPSGGMSKDGLDQLKAGVAWSNATLLIGDNGRNSETAILFETLLREFNTPFIITRDAIDLLRSSSETLLNRDNTALIASFAQLQKLLQAAYFPKQLLFSMQLAQVVEVLHKASLSYPSILVTFHQEQLIIAKDGRVITTPFGNPMSIWRGSTATRAAVYWLQNPGKPLEAITMSITTT
jgi:NAD(P)H-hydrate repair Nnr-like enzyme with NAD(P)H-hydrate dehydratase domain